VRRQYAEIARQMPLRGGARAARRAMSASGGISTDDVPSDHGFLNSSLTTLSSKILSRSLAKGGRRMYLHKASRLCSSLAATLVAAATSFAA
jgi:hypothetical protein